MKNLIVIWVFICLATVNSGVVSNGGTTTNIQGPSSQSRIVGPDGSVIIAEAPGGQIIHEETPGVFEPIGHFLGPASPFINPAVPGEVAHKAVDTTLAGPYGILAMGKHVAQTAEQGFTQ